jgi:sugar (pentulose or hexulose) kinase
MEMTSSYLLALDAGIGGGRCLVFDTEGQVVGRGFEEWVSESVPDLPGALSFDPDLFWATLVRATRLALRDAGIQARQIAAIGTTCMREGFVLLDAADEALYAGPSIDRRGAAENASLAERYAAEWYEATGHIPSLVHAPGRLIWLREHAPALFARARKLLMINDWMTYRLCGVWVGEPSNACSTTLLDARSGQWSDRVIEMAGLPREIFPPLVPSGTQVGRLSARVAAETGLEPGTPVVVGGGDAQCGVWGAGAVADGDVAAIAGTTTPILMVLSEPLLDPARRVYVRSGLRPGSWGLEANAGITGLAFRWLRDLLHELPGDGEFADMVRLAQGVPPGARGVRSYLGPHPIGQHGPKLGIGQVVGIGPFGGGRAELIRATMESVCYAVRANCEVLGSLSGRPPRALRLGGGQTSSPEWVQLQADVLGIPVLVPQAREISGWGAALCAGAGIGLWSDLSEAARSRVRYTTVEPNPRTGGVYEDLYQAWLSGEAA